MKVLIVAKTTNLELHGDKIAKRVAKGLLNQSYFERLQFAHDQHYQTLDLLRRVLQKNSIDYLEVSRGLFWPKLEELDFVFTVGGDGTVLEASHHLPDERIPMIGIRSSTLSVGHLCGCAQEQVGELVSRLKGNKLKYFRAQRLYAQVVFCQTGGKIKTEPILNDFLFANQSPALTSRYHIRFNDRLEDQKSSGVWVSTAAGSTAAIGAAGGLLLDKKQAGVFQYFVRELYKSDRKKSSYLEKGVFDPERDVFEIENHSEHSILALDGQHGLIHLDYGDKILFQKAPPVMLFERLG